MTEFVFNTPKSFIEAEKVIDKMNEKGDGLWDRPEYGKAAVLLMKKPYAEEEARWRWLAENKDELSSFAITTTDIGYIFADVVYVIDKNHTTVFKFTCDCWEARKYLKRKMKRFGISTDLICYW